MSILIKGIDLPKDAQAVQISYWTKDGHYITESYPPSRIVEIPTPHGRLVDADDIKAKCINEVFESMGTVAITDPYPDDEWADDICDVPTILEEEK